MPGNYDSLFKKLLELEHAHIKGLALLQNMDRSILKSTAGLFYLGAKRIAFQLCKNIAELPLQKREKLFSDYNIPIFTWPNMNTASALGWVKKNDIDLIINLRTRCIYKTEILKAPKIGCINIHHGILPKYRGTLCDLYALSENREAGFTIHEMNEKIDAGLILKTKNVSIKGEVNYLDYLRRTGEIEAKELSSLIREINKNKSLPDGITNSCDRPIFTRNPNREQIRDFIKKGMIL